MRLLSLFLCREEPLLRKEFVKWLERFPNKGRNVARLPMTIPMPGSTVVTRTSLDVASIFLKQEWLG